MTDARAHAPLLEKLPREHAALARVAQGLLLHEHFAASYGVELSPARRAGSQLRPVSAMLDRLLADAAPPLTTPRPLADRLVGVCRHFTLLGVAILRAQGVPARARCGFGTYFIPGQLEDHWVCEVWSEQEGRWVLVDTQLDAHQRAILQTDFDPLDVPRDRFVVAGEAWRRCRAGELDPEKCGIATLRGLWFAAGNVLRDLAALDLMEMLPWDSWGVMHGPGEVPGPEALALLDRAAALTRVPDAHFAELRQLYEGDARLRVPTAVFNALRNRIEPIDEPPPPPVC